MFICDVSALNKKFKLPKFKGLVPENVVVLDPNVIVLTLELLDDNPDAVTAYPAVVNVPFVTVSAFDPMFNASASCTVPP
jgi:hypothetical protein